MHENSFNQDLKRNQGFRNYDLGLDIVSGADKNDGGFRQTIEIVDDSVKSQFFQLRSAVRDKAVFGLVFAGGVIAEYFILKDAVGYNDLTKIITLALSYGVGVKYAVESGISLLKLKKEASRLRNLAMVKMISDLQQNYNLHEPSLERTDN